MQFTSFEFLFFVLIALFIASFLKSIRPTVSVALGVLFYGSFGWLLTLLALTSSFFDYIIVRKFSRNNSQTKLLLVLGVSLNLLFLVCVKISYWGDYRVSAVGSTLIPIGISFYTLQSISFLVDIYKKKLAPPDTYMEYLSYILFFPQLLAGPIERATSLLPQLKALKVADFDVVIHGIKLFLAGCYLKLVVANRLAEPTLTVATSSEIDLIHFANGFLSVVYIYADFFGYTLMARGIAKCFNVDLHLNFNRPLATKNLTGFWQSWHMSLTRWIGDYFYIPIMRHLKSKSFFLKLLFGVIAMVLIGLWHGIGWNFILFGFLHGVCVQFSNYTVKLQNRQQLPQFVFNETIFSYFVITALGNLFHITSTEGVMNFLNSGAYMWLSFDNLKHYFNSSFLVGCFALIPLFYYEFFDKRSLEAGQGLRHDVLVSGFFLLAIVFAHKQGGGHVYFAF
ncbi:MBOAT family O-acyltransferase [Terasakiella pusilla]|uniref:MBOAT family O-acyltransferase n=1 Tax=Terasakiella pusilla TaxID=64973 RepID=UPI003AA9BCCF